MKSAGGEIFDERSKDSKLLIKKTGILAESAEEAGKAARLGLLHSPGEAVQNEARAAIVLLNAVPDDPDDDLVRDQAAALHHCLRLLPDLKLGASNYFTLN